MTNMPNDNRDDWLTRYDAEQKAKREDLIVRKNCVIAFLKSLGVGRVEIVYDGEGDSGQIEAITPFAVDGTTMDIGQLKITDPKQCEAVTGRDSVETVSAILEYFAWHLLDAYHGGFENNEGGYGSITMDVATGTVSLDHNDRFVEINTTLTEI